MSTHDKQQKMTIRCARHLDSVLSLHNIAGCQLKTEVEAPFKRTDFDTKVHCTSTLNINITSK